MKAVIYARYSSDKQTEQSIEGQLRVCRAYAEQHGYTVVHEYIDRAVTGRTDKRPDFQRMMADAGTSTWDIILVYKFDRFARNVYDDSKYKKMLQEHGIRVVSASEDIPEGAEGRLTEGILVILNQYFSEELAIKTRRGMRESAYKCHVTGQVPYGYCAGEDKSYAIVEDEAIAVREIFRRYVEGETTADTVKWLNANGYRTHNGKPFQKTTVHSILRNEKYAGVYRYDDIVKRGGIPSIISSEIWEEAQYKMEKNRKRPGALKAKTDYLLSGKVFCGDCHEHVIGESARGRNQIYYYYKCAGKKKGSGCALKPVRKELLEMAVLDNIHSYVLNKEVIQKVSFDIVKEISKSRNLSHLEQVKKALEETEKSIHNLLKAIEAGIITESTKTRLEKLEQKRMELKHTIEEETKTSAPMTAEEIQKKLTIIAEHYDDSKQVEHIIDTLIYRVYLYDEYCVIIYNVKDSLPQTVEYDEIKSKLKQIEEEVRISSPEGSHLFKIRTMFPLTWGFGFIIRLEH